MKDELPGWMTGFPAALTRALELAQSEPLTVAILLAAAEPFGLHRGATFVELVGYAERETGTEIGGT